MNSESEVQTNLPAASLLSSRPWLVGVLLVAATIFAYCPVWHAGFFIWDDDTFLTANPAIQSADGLYHMWYRAITPDYYPVTYGMMWLEWRLWGNHAPAYHLVNVLLHGLSAVLLWRVLLRLGIPGAPLAAALFAVHPVNVESVAWITSRKNTLCMVFYLATVLAWLKFEDSGRRKWYGLALAGFALALLSKTAVAPLPIVLLGIAWWRRGRVTWQDARRVVPFLLIAVVLGLVTMRFQADACGHEPVRPEGFWSRLAGAGWAVWFYLYKALLPINLAFVYPRWRVDQRSALSYIPLVLLVAAFVVCWLWRRQWGRSPLFCLAYFVVMLLPVLGFINIYYMIYSLVADHWQYFAIIAPVTLAAALIRKIPALAAAVLLAMGVLTWSQCGIYTNSETLWQETLRLNPDCWVAHLILGNALLQKGQMDGAMGHFQRALQANPGGAEVETDFGSALLLKGKVDEAIPHLQSALQKSPDFVGAHCNLGYALELKGRGAEAMAQYQEALRLNSRIADAHFHLGKLLLQQGNKTEAIAHLQNALQINPGYAEADFDLGVALLQQGKVEDAVSYLQKTLQINPGHTEAHVTLGNLLMEQGKIDDAMAHFRSALQISPGHAQALNNLGNALLQEGKFDEAIAHFQQAVQISPGYAKAHNNLGNALLGAGRVEEAIPHFQRAVEFDPANPAAQNNLAWLLATCPQASLRNGAKAVELARRASELVGGGNPIVLHTLAAALAEAGRFPEAVETARRAMDLARARGNAGLAAQLQSEVSLYQAGRPFHLPAQKN